MKKAKQSNVQILHKQFSQSVPAMSAADCRYFIHLLQMRLNQQTEVRQKANSNDVGDEFYQLPLSSFGLSISTAGRLRNNGIITVKDAANLNKQAFLMVRNFGEIM